MSSTKQVKTRQWQGTQSPSVTEMVKEREREEKKNLEETRLSQGPVLLWPDEPKWWGLIPCCITSQTVD